MLLADFSHTLFKHWGWWALAGLLGIIFGWLLKSCFKPKAVAVADTQGIAKYESRVNELTGLRAKDLDTIETHRRRIAELEAAPATIVEKPVEKLVERTVEVESPALLARVKDLEAQSATYQTQIRGFAAAPPVEKIVEKIVTVEKIVEKPVEKIVTIEKIVEVESAAATAQIHSLKADSEKASGSYVTRIRELEGEAGKISGLQARIRDLESAPPKTIERIIEVEKIIEKPVDRIVEVEKIVEVESPALLTRFNTLTADTSKANDASAARIRDLETEAGQVAGLRTRINGLEGQLNELAGLRNRVRELAATPPKTIERVVEIEKIIEKPVDRVIEVERVVEVESPVVGTLRAQVADLEPRVGRIAGLEARIRELEAAAASDVVDVSGARQFLGAAIAADDLKVVEGIGPKIAEVFEGKGIHTWRKLARTDYATMRRILDEAGPQYRIADPTTWPQQAALLDAGNWEAFKTLTDDLTAGRGGTATAVQTVVEVPFDAGAAEAAMGSKVTKDDLKVVEGIGPRIEELCHEGGITTWRQLSQTSPDRLREILTAAGPRFQIHEPATWPRQAGLAVDGKWAELKALTDQLDAGRE